MFSQRARHAIRITVYVMLVLSAGTAFLLSDRLWTAARVGSLPLWAPLAPAALFTIFVFVYTIDRWVLVRRSRYPIGRALFQVGFALVFLTVLWPSQAAELREARSRRADGWNTADLLHHREPRVRATACELLGLTAQIEAYDAVDRLATDDTSAAVRELCAQALRRLHAASSLPTEDPEPQ